jgi:transposase
VATQGRPLSPECKRAIVLVKDYFDRTKGDVREQEGSNTERTAHALGVGLATVQRVMADSKRSPAGLMQEESIRRGRPPRVLADSLQTITREYVRQANREGSHLTLEMLSEYLQEEGSAPNGSVRTLGRALDRWGFTFGKGTRSQPLKEQDHVVAARYRSLRAKRGNRQGDNVIRPEVYLDESYVNTNHSNDFIWSWDEDGPWVQKPTGKGERLLLMHAMTKTGWIPTATLVCKSTRKTGDYHGHMHHELLSKGCSEQLLPTMPQDALILMENAPYHHVLSPHSAPTARGKKAEIRAWFMKNRLPVREDCLKAE